MHRSRSFHPLAAVVAASSAGLTAYLGLVAMRVFARVLVDEPYWQKALRWRGLLDDLRATGIDVPHVRMTHATLDAIDSWCIGAAMVLVAIVVCLTFALTYQAIWPLAQVFTAEPLPNRWQQAVNRAESAIRRISGRWHRRWLQTRSIARIAYRYVEAVVLGTALVILLLILGGLSPTLAPVLFGWLLFFAVLPMPLLLGYLMPNQWRAAISPTPVPRRVPEPKPRPYASRWLRLHIRLALRSDVPRILSVANTLHLTAVTVAYMRQVHWCDHYAVIETEPNPVTRDHTGQIDNTAGVFARWQYGCEQRRRIIVQNYRQMLTMAHPAEKCRSPIDVGQLGPEGRLLALPIVIGADNAKGVYDELDFALSDHAARRYVFRSTQKGIDLSLWTKKLPDIGNYLGGRWRVTARDGTTLTLEQLPDIPEMFPLPAGALKAGELFLGLDLNTGEPVHVKLSALSHTLVTGPTGLGKSVFLHQVMASVVHNLAWFDRIYMVDPKYGLELRDYADLSDKFTVVDTHDGLPDLLDHLIAEMDQRGRDMVARKIKTWDGPLILIVIDEFADILIAPEKKTDRDALTAKLTRLTNMSRAMGFRFWIMSQKFTTDAIPGPIRNNLQSLVAFRMVSNQQAAMLFGGIEEFPADIRELRPGQVIYRDGATSRMNALQGAMVRFEDVAAIVP